MPMATSPWPRAQRRRAAGLGADPEAAGHGQRRRLRLGREGRVIHGRRRLPDPSGVNYYEPGQVTGAVEADQSRLYYHRPLADGDVVTYEFLYEPGQVMVHPSLDRLAFLLEPEGVRLHWMTAGSNDLSGLPADNAIDEPASRRGPARLPLKPGGWNTVKLGLSGGKIDDRAQRPGRPRADDGADPRQPVRPVPLQATRPRPRCGTSC